MTWLRMVLDLTITLWAFYMLFSGAQTVLATTGTVWGSEFAMLITLAHLLGQLVVLAALHSLRQKLVERSP